MQTTLPPEILWKVINILVGIVTALIASGVSIFVFYGKSILGKLEKVDNDLKPLLTEIALQKQKTEMMHDRQIELERRVNKLESK